MSTGDRPDTADQHKFDSQELLARIPDKQLQERFTCLWAIRSLFAGAIVPPSYKAPPEVLDLIRLTKLGEQIERRIRIASVSSADVRFALFMEFAYREPFVDIAETDADGMISLLRSAVATGDVRYPFLWGRDMDDAYFEISGEWTPELDYSETKKLLDASPAGVAQQANIIVGPLGVTAAAESRLIPPLRSGPLMACSDPACGALHSIGLSTGEHQVIRAVAAVRSALMAMYHGGPSSWQALFERLARAYDVVSHQYGGSIPALIAGSFPTEELRLIAGELLVTDRTRTVDAATSGGVLAQSDFNLEPANVVAGMSRDQLVQLVLGTTDERIFYAADKLVSQRKIEIPPTEARRVVINRWPPDLGQYDVHAEAGSLGLRLRATKIDAAAPRLQFLIDTLYASTEQKRELAWKLREIQGVGGVERLARSVRTLDPYDLLRRLVFDTPARLETAFKLLKFGYFELPPDAESERQLARRILWKLGFNIASYPSNVSDFVVLSDRFRAAARMYRANNEVDGARADVRGAAVNLFVATEAALDRVLSFTGWALLWDHFGDTPAEQFKFRVDRARPFAMDRLNLWSSENGLDLRFDPRGKNTLYPLVEGLRLLAEIFESILKGNSSKWRRPLSGHPWFAHRDELESFPFEHTIPILDLEVASSTSIIGTLQGVYGSLARVGVANVRNRVEHQREDFPTGEELLNVVDALEEGLLRLEKAGCLPTVFIDHRRETDEFGRSKWSLANETGRVIELFAPSEVWRSRLPKYGTPQVIFGDAKLLGKMEMLRFAYQERSKFGDMWSSFPPRRRPAVDLGAGSQGASPEVVLADVALDGPLDVVRPPGS